MTTNDKYPQNLKESLISAFPNCTIMVLGMITVNLWIYGHLTLKNFLSILPTMYITAFILDFFIVGNFVFYLVKKYNKHKYTPYIRVFFMAGILTAIAPIIETGNGISLQHYFTAFPRNYIVALLLQIFIALKLDLFAIKKYKQYM